MKKFSFVICVVALVAVMLVGATAFASSGVDTNEHIYIGEYAHNNVNNSDPDVVIVYGTASVDAQDGVTERGIIIEKGADKWLFPALAWNEQTGNFGVAIIRSTVEKGEYVAKAFARVGGTYDEDEKEFVGGIIEEGDPISLNFNAVLAQTEESIIVTENTPVDLKEFITVTGGEKAEIVYTVTEKSDLELEIENGVVSYVSGAGRTTITATHGLSENSITFDVMAYDEVYEITDKTQLANLTTDHANSYVKLTADLSVETADMAETTVNNSVYATVIGGSFKGFFDGQNHKITYDFTCDEKDMLFQGVFCQFGGELRNLIVEGFAEQKNDYGYFFMQEMVGADSIIENCYVNVRAQQNASKSGNWTSTCFMIGSSSGTIKDCMFNMAGRIDSTSDFTRSMALQRFGTGVWENIVWIAPDKASPWRGGMFSAMMQDNQLENVVYYKTTNAFIQNDGQLFDYGVNGQIDNGDGTFSPKYGYVSTPITTAQVMGSAWTIDRTQFAENIKLNNVLIWETSAEIVEVTDEADFITKMNSATESTVVKLTQNLTFTTSHFTKETEENGATNAYKYDMYLIETFKGTLLGNGYTITYSVEPEGTREKTTDVRLRGLIEKIESTGKLTGVKIVGDVSIPYSFQTAFCEANYGVVENCYFDVKAIMYNYDGNNINTIGLFGRNDGTIRNSVLAIESRRSNQSTWQGMKMVHNGSDSASGRFINIALVQAVKRIGSRNNANTGGQLTVDQLNNVVYYSSLANLIAGTGELVTRTGVSSPIFEYTDITSAQNIGTAWTIDATGIKLNGNYVYQVPVSE